MGSPFASKTTSGPIPLPFDPPHTVVVRKLTGRELEDAQKAHAAGIAGGDARLWSARFRRLLEGSISDQAEIEQAIADPLTGYDRYALVRSGLVSWSYPESVKPVPARPAIAAKGNRPESPAVEAFDAVADLDDEAVDFIATEVLRLTKPALFHVKPEDAENERKNDSSGSMLTSTEMGRNLLSTTSVG